MRIRGVAILSALVAAAVAVTSCAEIKRLVDRSSEPVAASPTLSGSPAARQEASDGAEARRKKAREPTIVKGTGQFIDAKAAALPQFEVTKTGDVILNFAGADIQDVVRSIMGLMLKLNYVLHPKVQGKVTVQTSRPLPRSALLATLETILRIHGAAIVRNAGVYKILPINEAPNAGIRPSVDLPPGVRGQGFGIQIVPLEFISAREMEKILLPVSPAGGILRVDVARNLLLLAGTRQERGNMHEVIDIFDVDWLAGMSVALIPLQAAEPKPLLEDLQQVFGNAQDGPLAGVVKFLPIERLNAILVITSRPEYLDKAQSWIERLDGGVEGGERTLHVYLVQNARAVDLADVLNQIFGDGKPESNTKRARSSRENADRATDKPEAGTADRTRRGEAATTQNAQKDQRTRGRGPAGETGSTTRRDVGDRAAGAGVALPTSNSIRIIADEKNNALVIMATPREYRSVLVYRF